jgi:kumamolisin
LWSGLIALLKQKLGIPHSEDAFHDIASGSNGAFSAGPGWDAASGLGSPDGENLLQALSID